MRRKIGIFPQRSGAKPQNVQSFFGGGLLGSGFFDDFFSPSPMLMGRMGRLLEDPFDDFFADMPALGAAPARQETPAGQNGDALVDKEEQSRFAYLRKVNALKMEMKKAVHQEEFERAAQLRDEIRTLEKEHKEHRENK